MTELEDMPTNLCIEDIVSIDPEPLKAVIQRVSANYENAVHDFETQKIDLINSMHNQLNGNNNININNNITMTPEEQDMHVIMFTQLYTEFVGTKINERNVNDSTTELFNNIKPTKKYESAELFMRSLAGTEEILKSEYNFNPFDAALKNQIMRIRWLIPAITNKRHVLNQNDRTNAITNHSAKTPQNKGYGTILNFVRKSSPFDQLLNVDDRTDDSVDNCIKRAVVPQLCVFNRSADLASDSFVPKIDFNGNVTINKTKTKGVAGTFLPGYSQINYHPRNAPRENINEISVKRTRKPATSDDTVNVNGFIRLPFHMVYVTNRYNPASLIHSKVNLSKFTLMVSHAITNEQYLSSIIECDQLNSEVCKKTPSLIEAVKMYEQNMAVQNSNSNKRRKLPLPHTTTFAQLVDEVVAYGFTNRNITIDIFDDLHDIIIKHLKYQSDRHEQFQNTFNHDSEQHTEVGKTNHLLNPKYPFSDMNMYTTEQLLIARNIDQCQSTIAEIILHQLANSDVYQNGIVDIKSNSTISDLPTDDSQKAKLKQLCNRALNRIQTYKHFHGIRRWYYMNKNLNVFNFDKLGIVSNYTKEICEDEKEFNSILSCQGNQFLFYSRLDALAKHKLRRADANANESPYWYYSIKSGCQIIPSFMCELATAYLERLQFDGNNRNIFEKTLNDIKSRSTTRLYGDMYFDDPTGYLIDDGDYHKLNDKNFRYLRDDDELSDSGVSEVNISVKLNLSKLKIKCENLTTAAFEQKPPAAVASRTFFLNTNDNCTFAINSGEPLPMNTVVMPNNCCAKSVKITNTLPISMSDIQKQYISTTTSSNNVTDERPSWWRNIQDDVSTFNKSQYTESTQRIATCLLTNSAGNDNNINIGPFLVFVKQLMLLLCSYFWSDVKYLMHLENFKSFPKNKSNNKLCNELFNILGKETKMRELDERKQEFINNSNVAEQLGFVAQFMNTAAAIHITECNMPQNFNNDDKTLLSQMSLVSTDIAGASADCGDAGAEAAACVDKNFEKFNKLMILVIDKTIAQLVDILKLAIVNCSNKTKLGLIERIKEQVISHINVYKNSTKTIIPSLYDNNIGNNNYINADDDNDNNDDNDDGVENDDIDDDNDNNDGTEYDENDE